MIQLEVTSGKQVGTRLTTHEPLVSIGRNSDTTLCLSDSGVWPDHVRIGLDATATAYSLEINPHANVFIRGSGVVSNGYRLRPGDLIEIGAAVVRFTFSPTFQQTFAFRESLTWVGALLLIIIELVLLLFILP